jgi:hypothetical protein
MMITPKKQNKLSLLKPLSIVVGISLILAGATSWAQESPAKNFKRKAGNWMVQLDILKLEGAGTSEEVRLKMQDVLNKQGQKGLCLTETAADNEDFIRTMRNSGKDRGCTNVVENITATTMNIVAKCTSPDGKEFSLTMKGDYSPSVTNMVLKSENAPSKNGPVTMHMRTSSKWTGPCTVGEDKSF